MHTHNLKTIRENEKHHVLWDFETQTNHLIPAIWTYLVIVIKTKGTYRIVDFAALVNHRVKLKESEKKNKYLDLARELKQTIEHERDDAISCTWCARYTHQRIGTGSGGLWNKKTSGVYPNYNIIKIGLSSEMSFGDCHSNSSE